MNKEEFERKVNELHLQALTDCGTSEVYTMDMDRIKISLSAKRLLDDKARNKFINDYTRTYRGSPKTPRRSLSTPSWEFGNAYKLIVWIDNNPFAPSYDKMFAICEDVIESSDIIAQFNLDIENGLSKRHELAQYRKGLNAKKKIITKYIKEHVY